MKTILFLTILFAGFHSLMAQQNTITITGKVVENGSKLPLEYATVKLLDAGTNQLINGTVTSTEGVFALETGSKYVIVEIGFIGFVETRITDFDIENNRVNLGVIMLSEDTEVLEEVVVVGDKSQTVFKLDKRVFNVGQDLSSTGASALEVLNNVPSVTVDIEGQIRLRGAAGVQILVNGKPSVLASEQGNALGTLTADMIERIEVITNPSAKYDAEGTSGIINIVLKKEENRGLNGSLTLNTGVPNNHSLGLSLNHRTQKFNLFSQLGVGRRTFPSINKTVNENLSNGSTINSEGESEKNESFINVIVGTDYHINAQNVLSLTGHLAYEWEGESSHTEFSAFDNSSTLISQWNRSEKTEAENPKWQYELQYKRDFSDDDEHTLLFSALGSYFGKSQSSAFLNTPLQGDEPMNEQQLTHTDFLEAEYTFKLDYARPLTQQITWEAGAQFVSTSVNNDFGVDNWEDNSWTPNPQFTNTFEYSQAVLGVYSTGAYEGDKLGVKLGVRWENTDLMTLLVNTRQQNRQQFSNLFPTVHTSYRMADHFSMQVGYSRRISRPGLWDLNPFFNIRNNFSIRTGNPTLKPEFTDSYEANGIFDYGLVSLNAVLYYRITTDVVENVATFEDNISISKPTNLGTNGTTGVEVNVKFNPFSWWALNGDFNYNYFQRRGAFESTSFDFSADQWTARATTKFKLPAKIDFEVTGNYRSGLQTFQQEISGYMFVDLGLRKKVADGRTIINLSIRDLFATRIFESEALQPSFYLYNYRMPGRFITAGISYGFGKGEAMEFSGQKRF